MRRLVPDSPLCAAPQCRDRTAGPQIELEAAVKILTSDNADLYHLADRGLVRASRGPDCH